MRMVTTVAIIMNTIKKYMAFMTDMMAVIFALRMFHAALLPVARLHAEKGKSCARQTSKNITKPDGFLGPDALAASQDQQSRHKPTPTWQIRERIKNRPVDTVASTDKHKYSAILGKGGAIWKTATK